MLTATRSDPAADAFSLPALIAALRGVLPAGEGRVALHEPEFAGQEWAYVKDCLDTGWISSVGAYVDRFERDLAALCGTAHAVAVVNGTAALHVALHAVGVRPGDEVLVPALTFVATANAVSHCGAIPHFVDCDPERLAVDPAALAAHLEATARVEGGQLVNRGTGRVIRALVPVHVFGHPADMAALAAVAARFALVMVEDATEALGSLMGTRPVGGDGACSTLSFNGNKIITTGGGGAVLTNDPDLARRLKHLTTTAKQPHPWAFVHDEVAWNYRLPNINAALGCAQLEQLPGFVARKRHLAGAYRAALKTVPGVRFHDEPAGTSSNFWLCALLLDPALGPRRDEILAGLHQAGLLCRPVWTPMHQLAMHRDCPRAALPVTEAIAARLINLPSSARLGAAE